MSETRLFEPLKVGNLQFNHRVVMAPLTRFRANDDHVPLPIVPTYYGQRASVPGTFIVSEATFISPRASGYPNVPGIWNREQIAAWKEVTDAVHKKGSTIFLQLWALGRVAVPEIAQAEGFDVVSSSATLLEPGTPAPRALSKEEIQLFITEYVQAARNALEAGFDGVEIHGAGGYLIDQFTQDKCNNRDDEYGGSIENRSRFILEVASAVSNAVGPERVGIRLSPWQRYQGMRMDDPIPQFKYVIEQLSKLDLAYLHLIEARVCGNVDSEDRDRIDPFVHAWGNENPVILAGGFTPDSAKATVDEEFRDRDVMIAFGRHFISNPDLPFKIRRGLDLTPYNRDSFYVPESGEGYADYGFAPEFQSEVASA
ncbi:hypothetical protein ASPVEDRAFT_178817 [Aspergillus versicolor CBS 583.65]|uniref:NADH:flavin oxidoreductase/NADH oxidase N-terminal domain-containing protein n=1 Tax=Aspergillus versicolor CBS 583.65 TaxID=1036611 RepID=A0A1L9Q290_ASPVE|nr:uncharacterized protein ASPVEDRAFT_178817 [Aspergillus versicolor CBS 583.65]OJJ07895.1 hypothetical protein ASPVEDRAFT_178817 [Aspergillus versicolor CBS 583.65]